MYFCTSVGGFSEVIVPLDQYTRNSIAQVAEIIGEALDEPFLPAAPAERQCAWCDYQPICSKADRAGSVRRVPATAVESLVIKSVREHLKLSQPIDDRSLIHTRVARVEVQPKQLVIRLIEEPKTTANRKKTRAKGGPFMSPGKGHHRRGAVRFSARGHAAATCSTDPFGTRATLVAAIARGRRWLDEVITKASITTDSIAKRESCSLRKVNMTISLAFLAPDLAKPPSMADSARAWASPASRLATRMVPNSTRCSAFRRIDPAFEPSLCEPSLCCRETQFCRAETKAPKRPWKSKPTACRDKMRARIPANSGLFAEPGNLCLRGMRGGAGRSNLQTRDYELAFQPTLQALIFPGLSNRLTTDFSTGLQAQEERACEIEGTVETSMSMPVSPALPGLEVVQAPYRRETPEVQHECSPKANTLACARQGDDRSRQFNTV